ncbi:MAG: hypothetical protein IPL08_05280 [Saprospiraceae bacterium]|nr:hypothetical protein [Saprospiraceae bacterium]
MVNSTGEIKVKKHFPLDTVSLDRMNVESFVRTDIGFLIAGEFVNKNGIASGLIQWIDKDYNPVRTTTYNIPNNFNVNAIQDLQPDGYGNLVFATVFAPPGKVDNLVIRKLDIIRKVIKDVITILTP